MPRFEYRLNDAAQKFPVLYYYESMNELEVAMRMACDYFVKAGKIYLKAASSLVPQGVVVYVDDAGDDSAETANAETASRPAGITLEVREYREGALSYPLVQQLGFAGLLPVLPYFLADRLTLLGQEWEKTSTEIDEDRQVYVYYSKPAGR